MCEGEGIAELKRLVILIIFAIGTAPGADDETSRVLLVVNQSSALSRTIGDYYAQIRHIPREQICYIRTVSFEEISRPEFENSIVKPISTFLRQRGWIDRIHYIVTTGGMPLKIQGATGMSGDAASVDSELTVLYQRLKGRRVATAGTIPNPYFNSSGPFKRPQAALYMVTRLAGYSFADVKAMVDRAQVARNEGIVVIDMKSGLLDLLDDGELWLKQAANRLPKERVLLNENHEVIHGASSVIGYASWGSNDKARQERTVGLKWLPGGLATEFVSTDGRTFVEPPSSWRLGEWGKPATYHRGSPQSLTADLIREGATGASGHVYEPYLQFTPRPQYLFPAYILEGRNLAESFYRSIPALSWMNIVIGDPLSRLAQR